MARSAAANDSDAKRDAAAATVVDDDDEEVVETHADDEVAATDQAVEGEQADGDAGDAGEDDEEEEEYEIEAVLKHSKNVFGKVCISRGSAIVASRGRVRRILFAFSSCLDAKSSCFGWGNRRTR